MSYFLEKLIGREQEGSMPRKEGPFGRIPCLSMEGGLREF